MKTRNTIIAITLWMLTASFAHAQIPSGYYDPAANLSGAQLKTALQKIIRGHKHLSYTPGLWDAFYTTDKKPNGTEWDIYSDIPDGTANGSPSYVFNFGADQCSTTPGYEGGCYNREHTFPNSWWGGGQLATDSMYTDLFHIFPADSYVNTRRNNNPYGTVSAPTWTSQNGSKLGPCSRSGYSGTVFEPLDAFKGDIARNYFYMATRYESKIGSWKALTSEGGAVLDGTPFPCFEPWFLTMLGEWSAADPVSQKEIDRNNAVYALQGNRNPFIDHPEYVYAIWHVGTPSVLPEPTNYPASFSAHSIHLQWTDATGATLPEGYLIRMSTIGFNSIAAPVNGQTYAGPSDFTVSYARQSYWVTNLNASSTYYFKIYSFTGSGTSARYKTDGAIPQLQQTTAP